MAHSHITLLIALCLSSFIFGYFNSKFEPEDGRIVHGVHIWGKTSIEKYCQTVKKRPAILMDYCNINRPMQFAQSLKEIKEEDKDAIPQIGWGFGGTSDFQINAGKHDSSILKAAIASKEFKKPIFLRIAYEFNGWGANAKSTHPGDFQDAWIRIVNIFRKQDALNVAFVWHEGGGLNDFMDYYPGNDYVDWWGISLFYWKKDELKEGGYHWDFIDSAFSYKKPVMICESTPKEYNVINGEPVWGKWFMPVFNKLDSKSNVIKNIKALCYINSFWDGIGWVGWGDSRIEINELIGQNYSKEMAKTKWIHLNEYVTQPGVLNLNFPKTFPNINYKEKRIKKYENGALKELKYFKDGWPEGTWKRCHANGNIFITGNYVNKLPDGEWTYWHDNGKIKSRGIFKSGKQAGKWVYHYNDGQIRQIGAYTAGKRESVWKIYHEDGKMFRKGKYANGKKQGTWKQWMGGGRLYSEGEYENGSRTGEWKYWDIEKKNYKIIKVKN